LEGSFYGYSKKRVMKKGIFALITVAVVFASAKSQDTKEYVVLGQLN